mmetsp:Transcript_5620/g.8433  ORF Transcript_5620/g.8433 Transcript_5620/m.8433 type:complete len:100 (+) Transcript_5620:145-444(+)
MGISSRWPTLPLLSRRQVLIIPIFEPLARSGASPRCSQVYSRIAFKAAASGMTPKQRKIAPDASVVTVVASHTRSTTTFSFAAGAVCNSCQARVLYPFI